ncbi:nucleoside monophosphate kinase [Candidatus Nomurabacteria bacterium]|nr:nucleoside monophosphate kinase [Candidatus Nomurabacteria bacterium]
MQPLTIIFAGPQGSGKGTQVELLKAYVEKHDPARKVVYFEAGQVLREFSKGESDVQKQVKQIVDSGQLVPGFITGYLMTQFMFDSMKGDEHLFIDGFPREQAQLMMFDTAIHFYKRAKPTLLHINISDEEALTRLLKRARKDDTEEGIRNRLAWNRTQTGKVMEWFRANPDYRVVEVNGEQTIEAVHADILKALTLA